MLHTLWGSISAEALTEWDTGAAESWRVLSGGSLERIEERRAQAWAVGAADGYGHGWAQRGRSRFEEVEGDKQASVCGVEGRSVNN